MQQHLKNLYKAFIDLDCLLLEINPFVKIKDNKTKDSKFLCLDAKMSIDSNALFRQNWAYEFCDYTQMDEREVEADSLGIHYIGMGGNIGCMVNGAGLAMATMDLIKSYGGNPANFLDVGGSAGEDIVKSAFEIILSDVSVKGILVNIFGGIMKCDVIANGIVKAVKSLNLSIPLVVRLRGTNIEIGKKILRESGLSIVPEDSLNAAAKKIVSLVNY